MRESAHNGLNNYINSNFAHETPLLSHVREVGNALVDGMQISPSEGKTLQVMARMTGATRILEIGTFVGYSALWMAQALPDEGHITTLESSNENADIAQQHFNDSPYPERFIVKRGKALTTLEALGQEDYQCDMVFIDAAKSEYMDYLNLVTPMLRTGGLIVGDNTLLFGHMIDEPLKNVSQNAISAMQAFNQTLGNDKDFSGIMLPTEEGLSIGIKL